MIKVYLMHYRSIGFGKLLIVGTQMLVNIKRNPASLIVVPLASHAIWQDESVNGPPRVGDSDILGDSAASDVSQTPDDNTDDSWEHQLNTFKQEIEKLQERYEQSYLEIGRLLIQARDVYKGHGDWIKWLKENVPFSVRHAQQMQQNRRVGHCPQHGEDSSLFPPLWYRNSLFPFPWLRSPFVFSFLGVATGTDILKSLHTHEDWENEIAHFLHTFFPFLHFGTEIPFFHFHG